MPYFVNLTCTEVGPYCPLDDTIYGYEPSLGLNSFFVASFAAFAIYHAVVGYLAKFWFLGWVLTVGCIAEVIGYAGRIMLWKNVYDDLGFSLQISCLIFAPSFVAAGIYITFKDIVSMFGSATSILKPVQYAWVFISCDLFCLVLQAVGGGLAGSAGFDALQRKLGTDLMIAGVAMQVATLLAFAALVLMYTLRTRKSWQNVPTFAKDNLKISRFRGFLIAMATVYMAIFCRCLYRIPELVGGWANPIMRDEISFAVLEGG